MGEIKALLLKAEFALFAVTLGSWLHMVKKLLLPTYAASSFYRNACMSIKQADLAWRQMAAGWSILR